MSHRQSSTAVASVSTSSGLDRDYDVVEWKLKDLTELYGRDDFNEGRAIGALAVAVEYLNGRFEGTPL